VREAEGRIAGVDVDLVLGGPLTAEQRGEIALVAKTCRISRALAVPVEVRVTDA
jgi:hypothetical protein